MKKQKEYTYFILHVIIPILCSMSIYLLLREPTLVLWDILKKVNLYWFFMDIRTWLNFSNINLPDWILFNLPDGLWFYSFSSFIIGLWSEYKNRKVYSAIIILLLILSTFIEVAQYDHLIAGTFDFFDLLSYYLALTISYFTNIIYNNSKKHVL